MGRDIVTITEPRFSSFGRSLIAVIGIDQYRAMSPLSNAVNDACGTLRLFQQLGFEQATEPLLDESATAIAINRLVSDDLVTLDVEDNLVLFFAGHGTTTVRKFPDGIAIKTGYLVPFDATNGNGKIASWIKLDAWLDDVSRLPARHILVILDACYSGIALSSLIKWRGSPVWSSNESFEHLHRLRSRRIITSALDHQQAMDSGPVQGHSLFTGCLIQALTKELGQDGRMMTTGSELSVHLRHRVTTYPQSQQTPDFGALALDDRGEMIIPVLTTRSTATRIA